MEKPYAEAEKVDKLIGKLFKANPISSCPEEWLTVVRTIQSSLSIIEDAAMAEIMKKMGE